MSNLEYDRLYDELVSLEKETGIVLANSPTVHVGYEVLSELFVENATHRKNNDTVLKSTLIKLYDKDNTSMRHTRFCGVFI